MNVTSLRRGLGLLLVSSLWGCSASHPSDADPPEGGSGCAAMGGRCQSPDLPCGESSTWAGYELCGDVDNDSCCLPAETAAADAGARPALVGDAGPPPDAGVGAGATPDAGTPGDRAGVACGAATCGAGQSCRASCRDGASPAPQCVETPEGWEIGACASGEPDTPVIVAGCDGPEDCAGAEECLVLFGSLGNYPRCGCEADPDDGGCVRASSVVLCHTLADCPAGSSACAPDEDDLGGFYATCVR